METPKKASRANKARRGWKTWVISMIVVVGVVLMITWQRGYFDYHYGYRDETNSILKQLTDGEKSATEAYENSSVLLRESRLLASFVDEADQLTKILGTFDRIVSVTEVEMLNSIRGKTARVEYELRFASGIVTSGELSFLRDREGDKDEERQWRLLGYSIRAPAALADQVESAHSDIERLMAPPEVRKLLVAILEDTAKGLGDEVRAQASPPFRESSSEVQFRKMLEGVEKELGAFQHVLEFTKSDHNAGKTRAKLTAILQYEKARTTGTFEFIKVENEEQWRLLQFKVLIPEPLLPSRSL